jgi:hypothetical protein
MGKSKYKFINPSGTVSCGICGFCYTSSDKKRINKLINKHYLLKHNIKRNQTRTVNYNNYTPYKMTSIPEELKKELTERKE